jgi:hypothetical protein
MASLPPLTEGTNFASGVHEQSLSRGLPALSGHTFLRYFSFAILYVAQGVPEGMTLFGIPASAIIFIPFSFKIAAAC